VTGSVPGQSALGFPAVWLRHNCPCPCCQDPATGQRLIEITGIPNGCGVTVAAQTAESVEVVFTPEGHRTAFSRAWLAEHALPGPSASAAALSAQAAGGPGRSRWLSGLAGVPAARGEAAAQAAGQAGVNGSAVQPPDGSAPDAAQPAADPRTEDGKRLWRARDLAGAGLAGTGLPGAAWADYLADDAVRAQCLDAVAVTGFALLSGVDPEPGTVLRVAETFGFVRETNYGRLFDVRVVADPANLAFTSRAIAPHTDNPYRDPVPTLQLLHCLRDAPVGGDTGLVDGFAAAAALRAADPASFRVLAATPWPFAYADETTELRAVQPLITLTADGRITAVRLNNRSLRPLLLPLDRAAAAYAAYRAWAELLSRPEFLLTLRLAPGDCLVFDNTRVLHARTAFTAPGGAPAGDDPSSDDPVPAERHLQGCYADLDGLLSTLAVLRREHRAG
jgi:gamma-butyrobetaine dioxygenase